MGDRIRKVLMTFGVVIGTSLLWASTLTQLSSAQAARRSPWPMFQHDRALTGRSEFDTSNNPGQLKWAFKTGAGISSSPAIGADGTIYFGSEDHNFYAVTPDGRLKWKFRTEDAIATSPAIGRDGTIYFRGKLDQVHDHLVALKPDGRVKWKFACGNSWNGSPVIGSDGTIYLGSVAGNVYAVGTDGQMKWATDTKTTDTTPAIGRDGTIYVDAHDRHCLKAITPQGEIKWEAGGASYMNSPAVGSDGTIYINGLQAFHPDGSLKWSFDAHSEFSEFADSSPTIGADGTIYVGYRNFRGPAHLYAVRPDGQLRWRFEMGNFVSSPVVGADGTIYAGSSDNHLYALNPDGTQKWQFTTGGQVRSSPAIGRDGTVYVTCEDGSLYAVGTSTSPTVAHFPQKRTVISPWPMFHHDYANTSRTQFKAAPNPGTLKWKADGQASPPAIGAGGIIYVAGSAFGPDGKSEVGAVTAIEPNGKQKWQFPTDDGVCLYAPAIGNDGTIYASCESPPAIYAVTPKGKSKWKFAIGGDPNAAPVVGSDGTVYVGADGLYAIYPDGTEKWRFATGYDVHDSPAIGADGTVYVGFENGYLYALNSEGSQKWAFEFGPLFDPFIYTHESPIAVSISSPAIGANGTIYIGSALSSEADALLALDRQGKRKWIFDIGKRSPLVSPPALGADGTVYFHSGDTYLYAVGSNGQLKWKSPLESSTPSTLAVGFDGTIFVGSSDGHLSAVKPDGQREWGPIDLELHEVSNWATSDVRSQLCAPAIGADGTIYVDGSGQLYAIGTAVPSKPAASSTTAQ